MRNLSQKVVLQFRANNNNNYSKNVKTHKYQMFKHKAVGWLERRKLGTMILSCGIGWQKPPLVQLELYQEHASNDLISSGKGLGLSPH